MTEREHRGARNLRGSTGPDGIRKLRISNCKLTYLLATTDEITDLAYRARLKHDIAAANIGEREWLTFAQDVLLRIDLRGEEIWRPAERYPIPLVDDVIPNDRYMRDLMRSERCEYPERDKLIDLAVRASQFGR